MPLPSLKEAIAECQQCVEREERPRIEAVAVVLRAIKNLPEISKLCDIELRGDRRTRHTVAFVLNIKEILDGIPKPLWTTDPRMSEEI